MPNFSIIEKKLIETGSSPERAARAVELYDLFLTLARLHPDQPLVPPRMVDDAWHIHIDMDSYDADCIAACGRVIPHDPDEHGTPYFWEAWVATRRLYGELGVDLPARGDEALAPDLQAQTCIIAMKRAA